MASVYCAQCKGVPHDPVDSDCCSQIYCWNCVIKGVSCSFCGNPVDPAKCKENVAVKRIVNSLSKNCRYEGCEVVLPGDKIKEHESACDFKPCVCLNSELCGILTKRELEEHMLNHCDFRKVNCSFRCGAVITAKEFESHIANDCPEVTIHCNNMCNTQLKRGNLTNHLENECPYQPTPCEFAEHGCTKTVLRMQYPDHLESEMKNHFVLLCKVVKNQNNEIKELKQKVNQISNNGRAFIDAELLNNGLNQARIVGSSAAQFIGHSLECARLKGCQLYAQRDQIASKASYLLETSRIAQFALFFVLYSILSYVRSSVLFFLFILSTGFTIFAMFTSRNSLFWKLTKIVAWATIIAIIFHAQPAANKTNFFHKQKHFMR